MKNIYKQLQQILSIVIAGSAHSVKVSFMLGSQAAFFSLGQSISPALGFFGNPLMLFVLYATRISMQAYFFGAALLASSAFYLPSLCAAFYLSNKSALVRSIVPLACIALFITHPVGSQAAGYATYWLIPIVISFIPTQSILLRSLGSTFVAHAVGSVLWLFSHNLDAANWSALSSIVWAERLMIALGMTALYYAVVYSTAYAQLLLSNKHYSTAKKAN